MSLGTYLAYRFDRLLSALKFFAALIVFLYILSGIFNSIWASKFNDGLFIHLYHGKIIRSISISLSVLSFAFFFLAIMLLIILYIFGAAKCIQLILLLITIGSLIGTVVLLALSVKYTSPSEEKKIKNSFLQILSRSPIPDYVQKWANKKKCIVSGGGCNQEAIDYVHYLIRINYIFNICLVVLIGASLLGLMLDVIFMSLIKPVDRNQEHETSSEQEETVTQSVQLEQAGDPPRTKKSEVSAE